MVGCLTILETSKRGQGCYYSPATGRGLSRLVLTVNLLSIRSRMFIYLPLIFWISLIYSIFLIKHEITIKKSKLFGDNSIRAWITTNEWNVWFVKTLGIKKNNLKKKYYNNGPRFSYLCIKDEVLRIKKVKIKKMLANIPILKNLNNILDILFWNA